MCWYYDKVQGVITDMSWKRDKLLEAVGGEKVGELYSVSIRFVIYMNIEVASDNIFMWSGCCQRQKSRKIRQKR